MENKQLLECVEINPSGKPMATVIWMHGLGADGNDFASIVPSLNFSSDMPVKFLFPHAPIRPITINGGFPMRAWFDIYGLNLDSKFDQDGIEKSESLIVSLIEHEESAGIPANRILLAGFSQGGAMALFTGLRYSKKIAGIIALSGFLPFTQANFAFSNENKDTPIFLAHGLFDQIVDKSLADVSEKTLVSLEYPVASHFYSMGHGVCPEEIEELGSWVKKILI